MTREGRTRRAWVGKSIWLFWLFWLFWLSYVRAIRLTSCFVHRLEEFLVRAGFDAPDAAVERGYVYFEDVESAAGVVRAAPFANELVGDAGLYARYVEAVGRRLAEAGEEVGGFARVSREDAEGGGWNAVGGEGGDGEVMAIPAVAYFGHATAPWNVLGTKR